MKVYGKLVGKLSKPGEIKGKLSKKHTLSGKLTVPLTVTPPNYQGSYEVTPAETAQILRTEGLCATGDIVVNPIPKNYGLITYNGTTITVS